MTDELVVPGDSPVPLEVPHAVEIDDLHVRYKVYEDQSIGLRDLVSRGFRSRRSTEVHAVRGVSFNVQVGEVVGIVGSNGSGKSTLLRSIAGLQTTTSGQIRVRGTSRLLGVGAALKPTLSGRRNIILGGLAIGMTRAEIDQEIDAVIEFSGIGDAISRPMNTYSSGMRARLAFSIATLQVPDVLLIDEALAVGDKEFRARSLDRIREIRDQAGTVIMVTHNLREIRATCTRAIWIEHGEIVMDGGVWRVLKRYEK